MRYALPLVAMAALLPGCGNSQAEQLNEAANQSDAAAAQVLQNEAAAIDNGADPGNAQQVLEDAGNAQIGTPPASEQVQGNEANAVTPPGG